MSSRTRRWTKSIAVVVLVGLVTAIVLFFLTSQAPTYGYLGPLCAQHIAGPGFDPWTGEPHGRVYDCTSIFDESAPTTRITGEVPEELIDRLAVPLPVGFAIGALIALVWLMARSITESDRRRGRDPEATSR